MGCRVRIIRWRRRSEYNVARHDGGCGNRPEDEAAGGARRNSSGQLQEVAAAADSAITVRVVALERLQSDREFRKSLAKSGDLFLERAVVLLRRLVHPCLPIGRSNHLRLLAMPCAVVWFSGRAAFAIRSANRSSIGLGWICPGPFGGTSNQRFFLTLNTSPSGC